MKFEGNILITINWLYPQLMCTDGAICKHIWLPVSPTAISRGRHANRCPTQEGVLDQHRPRPTSAVLRTKARVEWINTPELGALSELWWSQGLNPSLRAAALPETAVEAKDACPQTGPQQRLPCWHHWCFLCLDAFKKPKRNMFTLPESLISINIV